MISLGFGHGWNNTNSIDDQHPAAQKKKTQIKCMFKDAINQLPCCTSTCSLNSMFWALRILFIKLNFQGGWEKKKNFLRNEE